MMVDIRRLLSDVAVSTLLQMRGKYRPHLSGRQGFTATPDASSPRVAEGILINGWYTNPCQVTALGFQALIYDSL